MAENSKLFKLGLGLLIFLVVATIFERFNIFLPILGFSLKLSLLILPLAALLLLFSRKLLFNPTFLFPALFGLGLSQLLSVFFSFDRGQSLQVLAFTILMVGLFYLLVWSSIARAGGGKGGLAVLTPFIWAWGGGALLVSLLGIGQFWLHFKGVDPALTFDSWFNSARTLPVGTFTENLFGILNFRTIWELGTSELLRPSSTFIDVNTGASFVGIFLLLGSGWWLSSLKDLKEKFNWDRALALGGLALIILISLGYFLLTISRSAALGLGVGAAVFLFFLLRGRLGTRFVGLLLAILVISAAWFGFNLSYGRRTSSSLERVEYAQAAWGMFKENPLTGVGVGNFEPYCLKVLRTDLPACYSHSIFLTWLGELGILGITANLGLIAVVFYFSSKLINTISRESTDYLRVSGLLSAFTALVFANIFHAHYGLDFTWVLLGLLVSGYYLTKRSLFGKITDLEILGVKVDNITMDGAVGRVKELFKTQKKGYVVTPNPEFIMSAIKDKEFTQILNKADLSVPDGAGLVWASRIWGTPLQGRVAGRDLFWELCLEASRRGGRVFLLGAAPGVAEKTAQVLKRRIPKIKIAGTFAGDGSPKGDEETINRINQSAHQPIDLLFVAYGHGKQERWIKRNLNKVKVKVAVGVGGTFDYVSGQAVLAPKFIRRLGLEWLYRLAREPWRMKRQWALLPFSFLTFKESFRR